MKKLVGILGMIGLMIGLEGCLADGEVTCSNETALNQFEFFLLSDPNGYYFSQTEDSEFDNFSLCEEILPADSMGINNIYAINGKLVDKCDEGACIRVIEYVLPYCKVTYTNDGGNYGVVGGWQLAHYYAGNFKLYPSCNHNEIDWTFEYIDQNSQDIVGGAFFGVNNVSAIFKPVNDTLMTISNVSFGTQKAVPYVAYFEREIIDFLEAQDTVKYQIDGSVMTLKSTRTDIGVRFFKP